MTKNPVINAFAAAAYILGVVLFMTWVSQFASGPDNFTAPLAAVSLFTLSAAVMGYIFCLEPIQMLFDGKKKQAVTLFLQTVMVFACITAVFLMLLVTGFAK